MINKNAVLRLENISRIFPRNITDIQSSILKEMLLPRSYIGGNTLNTFHALKNINITLRQNQKLGVIGSHQSGKTILANIASGLLHPSAGTVDANGSRLLLSRPTAGFKPTLTVLENLSFRAYLLGVHNTKLDGILESTLSQCKMSLSAAQQPIGNFSPYLIKQLAFTLLLSIETDILIIDEITSAGSGEARQTTRLQLQDKIEKCSSLIISNDASFLKETTTQCFILYAGELIGPYETLDAIVKFNQFQQSQYYSLDKRFSSTDGLLSYINEDDLVDAQEFTYDSTPSAKRKKATVSPMFIVTSLKVDSDDNYSHSKYSLLKRAGEFIEIAMELRASDQVSVKGGKIEIIEGGTGSIFAQTNIEWPIKTINSGEHYQLRFSFKVPENQGGFFGVAFSPCDVSQTFTKESRLKILIFGTGNAKNKVYNEIPIFNFEFNKCLKI